MAHPPMKSKYCTGPTEYEIQAQHKARRNEMARLRMARKRAELKQQPLEEQARAKARARVHQATYRQKNRDHLREWEVKRRKAAYIVKFGEAAYLSYLKAKRKRQLDKRRKKEAYHSADDQQHSDDEDQLQSEVDQPQSKADHDDERTNGYERDSEDDSSDDGLGDGGELICSVVELMQEAIGLTRMAVGWLTVSDLRAFHFDFNSSSENK
ncbi:hypothetical protein B0H13DRAFT_2376040 [Mycena leptocephala]|nr:hypothetical protein B0H13DRAFT_2376040 [Mycena leptocephala]